VAVFTRNSGGTSEGGYASLNLGLHVGDDPKRVLQNRERLGDMVGLSPQRITYMEQVHGNEVAVVGREDVGRGAQALEDAVKNCDGLVTSVEEAGLAVLAADCVPILMADPVAGVIAATHAGWRGATSGVATATVEQMVRQGAQRERIWVAFGPAIRGCCYEVDGPVIRAVEQAYKRFAPARRPAMARGSSRLHAQLDLPSLCWHELQEVGIKANHFVDVAVCTSCMGGQFSHRASHGQAGRHAGVIWRRKRR
ncbi:MAG: peptidoglycan editing factor PgeF, partial [Firmicutes bacterium]|nr:peptidoglycan editing factor PgeF [Bacillota bacterium]